MLFTHTLGLTHALPGVLAGKLSAYGELASSLSGRSARRDPYQLTADTGLVWQVADNVALDASSFFGLTRGVPDLNVFGGFAVRF